MNILVGTLFTIENEFSECVNAINSQTYRKFEHIIIKNLPNKEAHDKLYSSFMQRANEFDLFIKVDADMVIQDENLFKKIVKKFEENNWLHELIIAVYDFFSAQLISGMHVFRNSVQWEKTEENLFVDRSPVQHRNKLYDSNSLASAVIHCKNPSSFQSFHYGIHKALKILQPKKLNKQRSYINYHWNIIQKTWENFERNGDKRLGLAVLGAELAFRGLFVIENLDYSDSFIKTMLKKYENYDSKSIAREIQRKRIFNWGFLPHNWRREILFYMKEFEIINPYNINKFCRKIFPY
jgi:hypothetical protein